MTVFKERLAASDVSVRVYRGTKEEILSEIFNDDGISFEVRHGVDEVVLSYTRVGARMYITAMGLLAGVYVFTNFFNQDAR